MEEKCTAIGDMPEIESVIAGPLQVQVRFKNGNFTIYRWSVRRILDEPTQTNPDVKRPMSEMDGHQEDFVRRCYAFFGTEPDEEVLKMARENDIVADVSDVPIKEKEGGIT